MSKDEFVFESNVEVVKGELREKAIAWLYEASMELTAQTQKRSRVGKVSGGQTKASYKYRVNKETLKAFVGSDMENAIWEEYGTGEYAVKGDGRKGSWYVLVGNGPGKISPKVVEAYGFHVIKGKGGKEYVKFKGKRPNRPMQLAYDNLKPKLIRLARARFRQLKGLSE